MGAGRPKGSTKGSKVPARIALRLEQDVLDALERMAADRGVNVSELVRQHLARLARKKQPARRKHVR